MNNKPSDCFAWRSNTCDYFVFGIILKNKQKRRELAVNNKLQRIASSEKNLLEVSIYLLTSLHLPGKISRDIHEPVLEMARHYNISVAWWSVTPSPLRDAPLRSQNHSSVTFQQCNFGSAAEETMKQSTEKVCRAEAGKIRKIKL